jgi:hypothetical protein
MIRDAQNESTKTGTNAADIEYSELHVFRVCP